MREFEWFEIFVAGIIVGAIVIAAVAVASDSELGVASELCGKMWRTQDLSWYTADRVIPVNASLENRTVIVVCKLENLTGDIGVVY